MSHFKIPDYGKNIQSFSVSYWCGLPYELNPRKMVQMGFKCIGERKVQCIDSSCAQISTAPESVIITSSDYLKHEKGEERSAAEVATFKFLDRLKTVHKYECRWNQSRKSEFKGLNQIQYGLDLSKELDIDNLVISTKKLIFLRWNEIFTKLN